MAIVTVEQVSRRALELDPRARMVTILRRLAGLLALLLFALGWTVRRGFVGAVFAATWASAAVVLGWQAGGRPGRGASERVD